MPETWLRSVDSRMRTPPASLSPVFFRARTIWPSVPVGVMWSRESRVAKCQMILPCPRSRASRIETAPNWARVVAVVEDGDASGAGQVGGVHEQ
jgi:hypothetical protein